MFYRLKFDGVLSAIFKRCGYSTNDMLNFWPPGATPEWVQVGKREKLKAGEIAAIAAVQIAVERSKAGQLGIAQTKQIVDKAMEVALENNVKSEVLLRINTIAKAE